MRCLPNDLLILIFLPTEADRDTLDWSGKKPLDYQKQLTAHQLSSATFSSEYKVMNNVIVSNIQTLPNRQSTMKKLRNRERAAVQRSFTIMNDGGGSASRGASFDSGNSNETLVGGENLGSTEDASMKRKDKKFRSSFLKKSMSRKHK